jgi:hypothetical protein
MEKKYREFFINEVGMPKRVVFLMGLAKKLPNSRLVAMAMITGAKYLEKYYYKVGKDEYDKAFAKLRHPAYKRKARTDVI